MPKELTFSIITCTLQSEKFIAQNIKSVENQLFKNYEHIFVDGKSTDRTLEIIRAYKKRNPGRVKLFHSFPRGISSAMNVGVRRSTGKYVIHLHSDDSLTTNKVLLHVNRYLKNNPDLDWIYGKIKVIKSGLFVGVFPKLRIFQKANKNLLGLINYIPHQSVFIKKSVFDRYGLFSRKYKCCMDYDYWLRIAKKTQWNFIDRQISNYSLRPTSVSYDPKNRKRNTREYLEIQKKSLNYFEYLFAYFLKRLLDFRYYFSDKISL